MITIGIPTKEAGHHIYGAIMSAINQTYQDIEILIVNDNGREDYPALVDLQREFGWCKKLRIVHNPKNLGIGGARNSIIDNAKGEYIFFLSDDDEMLPNCIETFIEYSEKNLNSILYSNYFLMEERGQITQEYRVPQDLLNDFETSVINFAEENNMFVCYNFFGPTALFKKYRFNEKYRYGEDFEHLLRCALVEKVSFVHVPFSLFKYRVHSSSTTSNIWRDLPKNDAKIRKEINKLLGYKLFKK